MNPWIDVAGWTLVHFLWEGAAIGAIAVAWLWLLRDRSPQARYALACGALVAMLSAPLITAGVLSRSVVVIAPAAALERAAAAVDPSAIPDAMSYVVNAFMARTASSVDLTPAGTQTWLPLVVVLWIIGVAVLLLRLLGGWWRISRLQRTSRAATPSVWADAAARIAVTLGLTRRVHVVDSLLVDTPTVIGWMQPVVLLPIAGLAGLTPSQVEAILAHELAHIRRHDFLVNLLQTFAETMLFYHPAVWWLSGRIRIEREHCCDEVALSICGDAVSYAEALVELANCQVTHSRLAVAATGGTLTVRIRRLLGAPADDRPRSFGTMMIASVIALVICVAGGSRYLMAAQPDATAQPPQGAAQDPSQWSMTFYESDSTMRLIGFRGRDLIRFAYQVPTVRVLGGPTWLDEQILNIVVTLHKAPRADEMPDIVRHAVESHLQLKTHVEKRNFPVLALVMAREDRAFGPRLRVASRPCVDIQKWIAAGKPLEPSPEWQRVPPCGGIRDNSLGWTQHTSVTMQDFAKHLRGYVQGWTLAPRNPPPPKVGPVLVALRPPDIVDRTGLAGRYDLEFNAFYPTAALMSRFPFLTSVLEPMGFTSVPTALADQLGLKLVESEAPYDVIVIDQAERP